MKQCLLCGQTEPDDAATCRACGEASWSSAPARDAAPKAEPSDEAPRGKRGRR